MRPPLIGIDTGGTFTDVVRLREDGTLSVFKLPSTPDNPAHAVLEGIEQTEAGAVELVHGSTVATNALLERAGARCALVTTAGFEDLLLIGRQARAEIYALDVERVPPLVDRQLCFGVAERLGPDGKILEEMTTAACRDVVAAVVNSNAEAVAVCLLHSYANPVHERRLQEELREAGVEFVCASHEVLPEFREYERCSTTSVNAYVGPVMARYLQTLREGAPGSEIRIMQSNGGSLSVESARQQAVETVLSGPAGGVVGAFTLAMAAGYEQVVTFDMGGTSTDVSLCPGSLARTSESYVGGLPVRVPMLDIHTVGAGGGSIAWRDPAGGLRVGPRSAGAVPGPASYGLGGNEPTVTDANLYLGRLAAEHFLGGTRTLDTRAAHAAIERQAAQFDMSGADLAAGIVAIADSTMEGALRVISVERGHDPRDFTLVCFGGAGGLHAVSLAASLAMPRVLVPPNPGTLSAHGMLLADIVREYSRTLLRSADELHAAAVIEAFTALEQRAREDLPGREVAMSRSVDLRYKGQGYELTQPWADDTKSTFHHAHSARYGYADNDREVELVTVRLRATVAAAADVPKAHQDHGPLPPPAPAGNHVVTFDGAARPTPFYQRTSLPRGCRFRGPAIVVEYSSTTVVPPGWHARIDAYGNLVIEPVEPTGD